MPLMEVLSCCSCRRWITTHPILACTCGIYCKECCPSANSVCAECRGHVIEDSRLTEFHRRVIAVVPHHCQFEGCNQTVTPGDNHEQVCECRPIQCRLCFTLVPRTRIWPHFEQQHPDKKVLREGVNKNVLISYFSIDSQRKYVIQCFTQGMFYISITLNKLDSDSVNAQFMVLREIGDTSPTLNVKFDFTKDGYTYSSCIKDTVDRLSYADVRRNIVADWVDNISVLDLTITLKKEKKKVVRGGQKKSMSFNTP